MSITSGARPRSQAPSSARLWRGGLVAAAAATLVNALAWVVVQQLGDAELMVVVEPGGTELVSLTLGLVVGATLGAALVGAVALWLLGRRGPGGVRAWTALAVAFGLLSAGTPFGLDVSVARQLGLVLFHLLATATMVGVARQQLARG
jgi:Family of unknown function (DUF6069)